MKIHWKDGWYFFKSSFLLSHDTFVNPPLVLLANHATNGTISNNLSLLLLRPNHHPLAPGWLSQPPPLSLQTIYFNVEATVILLKGFVTALLEPPPLQSKHQPILWLTELYIIWLQVTAFILLPTNLPLGHLVGLMLCLELETFIN